MKVKIGLVILGFFLLDESVYAGQVLYVANRNGSSISTLSTDGTTLGTFATGVTLPGQIAFDNGGNLYVPNTFTTDTVTRMTPGGMATTFAGGINGAAGLVFDPSGFFYASASFDNEIVKISMSGSVTPFAAVSGGPQFLTLDASGNLYTSNSTSNSISMVTPGGATSLYYSLIDTPEGIAFDKAGNLYVALSTLGFIEKISADRRLTSIFARAFAPGPLLFDGNGDLYVGAGGDGEGTIYKYASDGTLLWSRSSPPGGLNVPNGLGLGPAVSTPEPSSLVLCALGGLVVFIRSICRRGGLGRGARPPGKGITPFLVKRSALAVATLSLIAMMPARVQAGQLTLNDSGVFGPTTTLDGSPLGADTAFAYAAVFDPTKNQSSDPGIGFFQAVVTFDISEFGKFTSAAGADVNVGFELPAGSSFYEVALSDSIATFPSISKGIYSAFSTSSSSFSAESPSPTTFSGVILRVTAQLPWTIPLAGGAGDLVIDSFPAANLGETATITSSAVPEPPSLVGAATALFIGPGAGLNRRKRS